jgi:D-inositol-3-phosphate glycosyltransferase
MTRRHPLVRAHHTFLRYTQARRTRRFWIWAVERSPGEVPPLRGHVDGPARNAAVPKSGFLVQGWSAWGDHPARAVVVTVNETVVARGLVGSVSRPDVGYLLGDPALEDTGWRIEVVARHLEAGEAQLSVRVWGDPWDPPLELDRFSIVLSDDLIAQASSDITQASSEFVGLLERPAENEEVGPVFSLSGWIAHRSDLVARAEVMVDGQIVGRARLGMPRYDVSRDQGGPEAIVSGFDRWIDISGRSNPGRELKLQVVASSRRGPPTTVFERTVRVAPKAEVPDRSARRDALDERWQRKLASIDGKKSSELNLAVFTHQVDYGGGQLWLDEFLERSGAGTLYPCTVFTYRDGPLRERMESRGIAVHVTKEPSVEDMEEHDGRITELAALVAAGGHNGVLLNTAGLFSGAEVANRLGLPAVWAIHESLPAEVYLEIAYGGKVHSGVRAAFFEALGSVGALVFEAEATRLMYSPWASPGRSIVVPYGVNTRVIGEYCKRVSRSEARSDVKVAAGVRLLLVMGTVEPRKAQTAIAQALRLVRTDHREWMVVFVGGSDSVYCDVLKKYVKENRLEGRVKVAPVDKDPYRWYRAADVLLSASDMESLPRSMLEAMCFGVPVVSTAVFGVPSLLQDGQYGILFEPNDLNATLGALNEVLSIEEETLRAIGDAAREHVLAHYDSAGYVTDLMALCQGLLQSPELAPREILTRWGRDSATTGVGGS